MKEKETAAIFAEAEAMAEKVAKESFDRLVGDIRTAWASQNERWQGELSDRLQTHYASMLDRYEKQLEDAKSNNAQIDARWKAELDELNRRQVNQNAALYGKVGYEIDGL